MSKIKKISLPVLFFFGVFGSTGQLQAVNIYFNDWTTSGPITSFSYSGPNPNVALSGTVTGLSPVDIVVPMILGGTGPQYSFSITLTNQTSLPWTDFHFVTGNGTGASYEISSGQDQPLFLTNISSNLFASNSLVMGSGEGGTPNIGIFNMGINWDNGIVGVGGIFTFLFSFQANDSLYGGPNTQWNTDFYPFFPPTGGIGFYETLRIFPTTEGQAEVPEPATMLLVGSSLIGLWGARKKFKK